MSQGVDVATKVHEILTATVPHAGVNVIQRRSFHQFDRDQIEGGVITVVSGYRESERAARSKWERTIPVAIVLQYGIKDPDDVAETDNLVEGHESMSDAIEAEDLFLVNGVRYGLIELEVDAERTGLVDSQHAAVTLNAFYKVYQR